jgi:putative SOS response-associated peptidase YedK
MGQGSITSFTFAGLWDEWKDRATGETLKSCTMIVTKPNDLAAEIHDRMPVMLERADFASWLNFGGTALLTTCFSVAAVGRVRSLSISVVGAAPLRQMGDTILAPWLTTPRLLHAHSG